jgi:hypothetical protein
MLQNMTPAFFRLVHVAVVLLALSASAQMMMHRKKVVFLLRSPFGAVLNMVDQWNLRRGSRDPSRNRLRRKRWIAREVLRLAICDYFGRRKALKPSMVDILTVIAYAVTLPASRIGAGVVPWLTFVAFVVLLYYFFALIFNLSNLVSMHSRLRLSYVFGSILAGLPPDSPGVRDLISCSVIPQELEALAVTSADMAWWAKRYWSTENHDERKNIGDIIQQIPQCNRVELDLRMLKARRQRPADGRAVLAASPAGSPGTHDQSPFLTTQEEYLSLVPIELAWHLRLDPDFSCLIESCVQHAEGSKRQRRDIRRATDYIHEHLVADTSHANHLGRKSP